MLAGWNDSGYMFDGSSMMFSDVQSLLWVISDKVVVCKTVDNAPVSDMILVHELDTLVS